MTPICAFINLQIRLIELYLSYTYSQIAVVLYLNSVGSNGSR